MPCGGVRDTKAYNNPRVQITTDNGVYGVLLYTIKGRYKEISKYVHDTVGALYTIRPYVIDMRKIHIWYVISIPSQDRCYVYPEQKFLIKCELM